MSTQPHASAPPGGMRTVPRERWTKMGPVISGMPEERVAVLQERSEASVGEPGGFSLFGFAVGTLIIAIPLAGFVPLKTGVLAAARAGNIGGYFLILSAGLAFYGASALVINSSFQRRVLPLLSRA